MRRNSFNCMASCNLIHKHGSYYYLFSKLVLICCTEFVIWLRLLFPQWKSACWNIYRLSTGSWDTRHYHSLEDLHDGTVMAQVSNSAGSISKTVYTLSPFSTKFFYVLMNSYEDSEPFLISAPAQTCTVYEIKKNIMYYKSYEYVTRLYHLKKVSNK